MPTPRIEKIRCSNPACDEDYHVVVVDEECLSRPCWVHRQCPNRHQGCDMLVLCDGESCYYRNEFYEGYHWFCGAAFLRVPEGGPEEGSSFCLHCYEMDKIFSQQLGIWEDEWASLSDREGK